MTAATSSDSPDPAELARQFMDLWQRQVSLMAGEGGLADAFALMVDLMAGQHGPGRAGDADGPSAAAAAPGQRGDDRDELARRLAACEARLDRLEQQLTPRRPRAAAKPRKRRP